MCLPPPFILGCAAVETSSPGQRQQGLLPSHVSSSHQGLQDPGCCCANTGTLGFGGNLGIVVSWTSEKGSHSGSQFEDTWVVSRSGVLALP